MADFENLDALLSSSLKSAAEPENSAGVADAIRSRVAAGDAGTSVAGSTAPGWTSGPLTWLPWIGLIVVAGIVGGTVGVSGVLGAPSGEVDGSVPAYVITSDTAPVFACPGGQHVGMLPASTRVLAVARDDEGAYLGVRDPADFGATVWFATEDLVLDGDSPDVASLPVEECDEVTVTQVTPTPTPTPDEPDPEPTDQRDTTPPNVDKTTVNPSVVLTCDGGSATVKTNASDNVGVVSVTVDWFGAAVGSAQMTPTGGTGWQYSIMPPTQATGPVTVVVTARDAAGNTASQQTGFTAAQCGVILG